MENVHNTNATMWKPKYKYSVKTGRPTVYMDDKHGKHAVRKRVHYAIKIGRLVKPDRCEYANCPVNELEAHHPEYNRPLDVLWLCKVHHNRLHIELKKLFVVF